MPLHLGSLQSAFNSFESPYAPGVSGLFLSQGICYFVSSLEHVSPPNPAMMGFLTSQYGEMNRGTE